MTAEGREEYGPSTTPPRKTSGPVQIAARVLELPTKCTDDFFANISNRATECWKWAPDPVP